VRENFEFFRDFFPKPAGRKQRKKSRDCLTTQQHLCTCFSHWLTCPIAIDRFGSTHGSLSSRRPRRRRMRLSRQNRRESATPDSSPAPAEPPSCPTSTCSRTDPSRSSACRRNPCLAMRDTFATCSTSSFEPQALQSTVRQKNIHL
jgi:hypothetical protein